MVKIVSTIISLVINMLIFISLIYKSITYTNNYNIWIEEEDKLLPLLSIPKVIVVTAAVLIPILIAISKKNKSVVPDYYKIRTQSIWGLVMDLSGIFLFFVVSKEVIGAMSIGILEMDLLETIYMSGHYEIFRNHLIPMFIVSSVSNIISICDAQYNINNPSQTQPVTETAENLCPNCHHPITDRMNFCKICGHSLKQKEDDFSQPLY